MRIAEAFVEVLPELSAGFASGIERGVQDAGNRAGASGGRASGGMFKQHFGGAMAGMGAMVAGAFAVDKVTEFFGSSIDEARESQKVGAQTAAVIKSTGGVANVTASQFGDLATAISNKTGIDDEQIQSSENMLATFTNIRNGAGKTNDIFNQATQTVTDMAAATGGDAVKSSVMLGKALNDPTKGVSALSRVGVTFTEGQKKSIKAMQEHGNMAGAQKVILGELSKEFGGSAVAQATAGDKAKVAWGNLKESVGTALLPVLDKLMTFVTTNIIPGLSTMVGFLSTHAGPAFKTLGTYISPLLGVLSSVFGGAGGGGGSGFISQFIGKVKGLVAAIIPIVSQIIGTLRSLWPQVQPVIAQIGAGIRAGMTMVLTIISTVTSVITAVWRMFGSTILSTIKGYLSGMLGALKGAFSIITGVFKLVTSLLTGNWKGAWAAIKQILSGAVGVITGVFKAFTSVLKGVWTILWGTIKVVLSAAWNGIKAVIGAALGWVKGQISASLNAWKSVFSSIWNGIKSVVSGAWSGIKSFVSGGIGAIKSSVSGGLSSIKSTFTSAWSSVSSAVSGAWGRIKSGVTSGISGITSAVSGLPGRITSALGNLGSLLLSAGSDVVSGLVNGISGGIGRVMAAARNLASSIPGPIKKLLGIASPSKLMIQFGGWVTEGLAKGMTGSVSQVAAASKTLTGYITSVFVERRKAKSTAYINALADDVTRLTKIVAAHKKVGGQLAAIRRKIASESKGKHVNHAQVARDKAAEARLAHTYNAHRTSPADLARAKANLTKSRRAGGETKDQAFYAGTQFAKRYAAEEKTLTGYAAKRAVLATKIKAASAKLADAMKVRSDYAASVRDQVKSYASITGLATEGAKAGDLIKGMQQKLANVRAFTANLAALKKLGLGNDVYKQIVDAGVEGGSATATALLAGGKSAVTQVNSLQAQINSAGNTLGSTSSNVLYTAGVNAASGLLKGLESQDAKVAAAAKKLAATLAKEVKRALGIKSPSRLFDHEVGRMLPAGIIQGIDHGQGALDKRVGAMVNTPALSNKRVATKGDATAMTNRKFDEMIAAIHSVAPGVGEHISGAGTGLVTAGRRF